MARDFAGSGAGTYINCGLPADTQTAFSVACWFQLDGVVANNDRLISRWGNSAQRFLFQAASGGIQIVILNAVGSGISKQGATALTAASGVWKHAAAVFTPSVSLDVFLNGTLDGHLTTGVPATMFNVATPREYMYGADSDTLNFGIDGRIAEGAYWTAALTAEEVAALARGVQPSEIRPGSLVCYHPLHGLGTPEPDLHPLNSNNGRGSTFNGTVTGSTRAANHAPVGRGGCRSQ